MQQNRTSGILLHPTSLPGPFGIGSLGRQAIKFVDFLETAGQKLWQVLPMGHTGYGDSPYQCFSIFAGNPILIDLEFLVNDGLLHINDLPPGYHLPDEKVEYGNVINFKKAALKKAFLNFSGSDHSKDEYHKFVAENEAWLHDYAVFISIKETLGGMPWWDWSEDLKLRNKKRIDAFVSENQNEIQFHKFVQYLFNKQWQSIKKHANSKGIAIVGDIPLYVAHDSADVWSNQKIFQFDKDRNPLKVAGVPPDYFSKTGQLWGNPLYDWDYLKENGYQWWIERIKGTTELYDIVRIDHFRGFEAYWAVPYGDKTAMNGKWVTAPGKELFKAVKNQLGTLPIIAEDLGIITPEVEELRDEFEFPGMKILQFAFHSDEGSGYLPHNYTRNFIVYTGTHDNDTLRGWFNSLEPQIKQRVLEYADASEDNVIEKMIRLAWSSTAKMAVIPLQDLLGLGSEARMNTPGTPAGNWQWRFREDQLNPQKAEWLKSLTTLYNR
jgi:4-alpha-glucanotransferase